MQVRSAYLTNGSATAFLMVSFVILFGMGSPLFLHLASLILIGPVL